MKMKCYLDANILLYFSITSSQQHSSTVELVEKLLHNGLKLYISSLVLDEFVHGLLRVLRKDKHTHSFEAMSTSFNAILQFPHLKIVNPPTDPVSQLHILTYIKDYSLKSRDAYHLLTIRHHGISHFATFDADFEKVFADGLVERY